MWNASKFIVLFVAAKSAGDLPSSVLLKKNSASTTDSDWMSRPSLSSSSFAAQGNNSEKKRKLKEKKRKKNETKKKRNSIEQNRKVEEKKRGLENKKMNLNFSWTQYLFSSPHLSLSGVEFDSCLRRILDQNVESVMFLSVISIQFNTYYEVAEKVSFIRLLLVWWFQFMKLRKRCEIWKLKSRHHNDSIFIISQYNNSNQNVIMGSTTCCYVCAKKLIYCMIHGPLEIPKRQG